MKLLTQKQKQWIIRKTIKVGNFYSFPAMGFTAYAKPEYGTGVFIDTNPATKSLAHEFFLVKEITDGFCKGNFYNKPSGTDMYITQEELSRRNLLEMAILFLITALPLIIYNIYKGGVTKMETKID